LISPYGDRDWIIRVECSADAVRLSPGRARVGVAALEQQRAEAAAFLKVIQDMIARRQATLRPGEPPYRPQIRFLIQPDGWRSFYAAYPVIGTLQIPMSRENLKRDEEPQ